MAKLRTAALIALLSSLPTITTLSPVGATLYKIETNVDDATDNGNCTLREAIRAANTDLAVDTCAAGEVEDTIQLSDDTYPFSGQETINTGTTLTIRSESGDPAAVKVDLGQAGRFLHLVGGETTLSGFTIQSGSTSEEGGAISATSAGLTLDLMHFFRNAAEKQGGAVALVAFGTGSIQVTRTTFTENSAIGIGGALSVTVQSGSAAELRDVIFEQNTATEGAFFSGNAWGGALSLDVGFGSVARCVRCDFLSNGVATIGGQGSDNAAGGGAFLSSISGGDIRFYDAAFVGNSSSGHSDFTNSAALYAQTGGASLILLDRILVDQSASGGDGPSVDGQLLASGGAIVLSNARFSRGNADGLAAWTLNSPDLRLHQVTVADYASGTGLILNHSSGSLWLANSLLALNATDLAVTGSPTSTDNCIDLPSNFPEFVDAPSGNYRLSATSAAVDAGAQFLTSPRFADLDHFSRWAGASPDCGAYESGSLYADDFEVGDAGAWSAGAGL